jgi:hypothetical protein
MSRIVVMIAFSGLLPFSVKAIGDDSAAPNPPSFFLFPDPTQKDADTSAENQAGSPSPGAITESPPQTRTPMSGKERFQYYLHATYSPRVIAYSLAGTGLSQARDSVPEWGQGMEGYGKRLGSRFARRTIKYSIHHGLAGLLHEDPRYFYSNRTGIWRRSLYAACQSLITHTDSGGIRPAYSELIGMVSATYIERQWRPEADQTIGQYAASSAVWLGLDAAKNVFTEFWPDIKRRLHH